MRKLTKKQERFCKEYIIDLNATQAAIRAGYSKKTSYSIGGRLLKDKRVQAYVQKMADERANRVEVSADYVLKRLLDITGTCLDDFVKIDPDGVISGARVNKDGKFEHKYSNNIKSYSSSPGQFGNKVKIVKEDSIKALQLLGEHLNLFSGVDPEDEEQATPVQINIIAQDCSLKKEEPDDDEEDGEDEA